MVPSSRPPPGHGPTGGRPAPDRSSFPPDRSGSYLREPLDVDEARHEARAVFPLALVEKLENEALTTATAVDEEVLQLREAIQVDLQLRVAPADTPAEEHGELKRKSDLPFFSRPVSFRTHSSRSMRSLLVCGGSSSSERPRTSDARRFAIAMSSSVASMYSSVVSPRARSSSPRALILVEERDRTDEREVLDVIAPRARAIVEKGQRRPAHGLATRRGLRRRWAFRWSFTSRALLFSCQEPSDGFRFPLPEMDLPRLLAVLVDRKDEAAIEELLVDLGGRRRQENRRPGPRPGIPA